MNVTQVTQSTNLVKNKGKETKREDADFSKAFEKLKTAIKEKEKKSTGKDAQSEGLKDQSTDTNEEAKQEVEPVSFTLINPFLDLETQVKDLSVEVQMVSLHTETPTNESNLSAGSLSSLSEADITLLTQNGITFGELAENLTQEQLEALTLVSDPVNGSDQVIVGEALSKLVSGGGETVKTESRVHSGKAVAKEEIMQSKKNNAAKPETVLQTDTPPAAKGLISDSEETQTVKEPVMEEVNSKRVEQKMTKPAESSVEQLKSLEGDKLKTSKDTFAAITEESKHGQSNDMTKVTETKVATEASEKLASEVKTKETLSRSDTDYDFVSMLRQMSSQSTKESSHIIGKNMTDANVSVPKEQGLNLIQDMVTQLVENKDGQKTYQTTLHLTPESLGKVTVELSLTEDGLSGKLTFQSDEARRWMEGEWLDLKLPLESKGLKLNAFDFTTSQPATQQQNGFSFSEHSSQSGQDSKKQSFKDNDQMTLADNDEQRAESSSDHTKGLNVYV